MNHSTLERGSGEKAPTNGRKLARERLLRSAANLRDFVDKAPEGLRRIGPNGLILWANQAELDMLGYTREEYFGHHIIKFHADLPVIEDFLARLFRGETLREREARMICKDGSIRHVLLNSSALFESGKFIHSRCFTRDITDRKRAEEKIASAYKQEFDARALAEAASRSKDEFIAAVLHALRTPLNSILACNRLLREAQRENTLDAAQLKHSCELIERNARAQMELIEDLLDPTGAAKLATVQQLMFGPRAGAANEARDQAELFQSPGGE
jgi:PAS domain S-box-containing protein